MHKIFIIFFILPSFIFAAYNPFFSDAQAPKTKAPAVKYVVEKAKIKLPARTNINMTYIGFVETKKGIFALVTFSGKNIVVQAKDSLYNNEEIYKIKKITSNYILVKDKHYRTQKVYFSSQSRTNR